MNGQPLVSPDKAVAVRLSAGEYWVSLALRLTHEFTGGELVRFSPGATVSVEGADEWSSPYTRANWVSGIASGALYAFRALRIPRQHLFVTDFTGRLRACDMDAVANGAALAIAKLAEKELPGLTTEGWAILARVDSHEPTDAATPSGQKAAEHDGSPGDSGRPHGRGAVAAE
jgi:hypothetical protein